jgi:hypothetical protein
MCFAALTVNDRSTHTSPCSLGMFGTELHFLHDIYYTNTCNSVCHAGCISGKPQTCWEPTACVVDNGIMEPATGITPIPYGPPCHSFSHLILTGIGGFGTDVMTAQIIHTYQYQIYEAKMITVGLKGQGPCWRRGKLCACVRWRSGPEATEGGGLARLGGSLGPKRKEGRYGNGNSTTGLVRRQAYCHVEPEPPASAAAVGPGRSQEGIRMVQDWYLRCCCTRTLCQCILSLLQFPCLCR